MIWLHVTITALLGFCLSFLGGHDGLLTTLVMFTVLDYLTGVMVGIVQKNLSSAIGFKGIFQKIMMFVMIGVAHILDEQILGSGNVLRSVTICFYASNEGISILENATHLGLPVPSKLTEVLENLREQEEVEPEMPSVEVEPEIIPEDTEPETPSSEVEQEPTSEETETTAQEDEKDTPLVDTKEVQ